MVWALRSATFVPTPFTSECSLSRKDSGSEAEAEGGNRTPTQSQLSCSAGLPACVASEKEHMIANASLRQPRGQRDETGSPTHVPGVQVVCQDGLRGLRLGSPQSPGREKRRVLGGVTRDVACTVFHIQRARQRSGAGGMGRYDGEDWWRSPPPFSTLTLTLREAAHGKRAQTRSSALTPHAHQRVARAGDVTWSPRSGRGAVCNSRIACVWAFRPATFGRVLFVCRRIWLQQWQRSGGRWWRESAVMRRACVASEKRTIANASLRQPRSQRDEYGSPTHVFQGSGSCLWGRMSRYWRQWYQRWFPCPGAVTGHGGANRLSPNFAPHDRC